MLLPVVPAFWMACLPKIIIPPCGIMDLQPGRPVRALEGGQGEGEGPALSHQGKLLLANKSGTL